MAQDKAAEIVVIGGGFSAISAAMRIEKLIGPYTRVNLTLVHDSSNMLFYPLLPEVVSGGMQPGNVVNPIRRIIPQTRVLSGKLRHVDDRTKRVAVKRKNGRELLLPYDQLILAVFLEPDLAFVPGGEHAFPADPFHWRRAAHSQARARPYRGRRTCRRLERAAPPADFRGRGLRPALCSTAVELCEMLRTAEVSYPVLREHGWQASLYEDTKAPYTDFEAEIQSQRNRELEKADITLCSNDRIIGLTDRDIRLASGERRPVGMVVNGIVQAADDHAERTGVSLAAGGGRRSQRQGAREHLVGRHRDARGPRSFQHDSRSGRLGKRRRLQRLGWFTGLSKPEILAA